MIESFDSMLKKYAELIIKKGLNIQNNGLLFINSPIKCSSFARTIAEEAFKVGAKDVYINYSDEDFSKIRYENASLETLAKVPQFEIDKYNYFVENGASILSISASNPDLLKDVDSKKIATSIQNRSKALKSYSDKIMNNENAWCVVSIPTEEWACKVFKEYSKEDAISMLWNSIFKIMRVDKDDPVNEWTLHSNNLKRRIQFFKENNFSKLYFKNSLGTNLEILLPEGHLWCGGSEFTKDGLEFIANMPTEEIFTLPLKTGVNGTVVSTKPLNFNGSLIENFSFTFKNGKVINFTAEKGYDSLKELLATDDGSKYLGEVALVPYDSPISNSNILFFNTLYDENASCHLALGKAYPSCLIGGEEMSEEELDKNGVNTSLTHVDFMIGSKDLDIIGINKDGKEITIFKDGNFAS